MQTLIWILLSTIIISAISLVGMITLGLNEKSLKKLILFLVSLSAGALMGGAFLHLIPESLLSFQANTVFILVLAGFGLFFCVEHYLKWRHCHDKECEIHTFAHMNMFGESIHNFIDGLIIAAAFITSTPVGIAATIAVSIHEIPQEFGDFGILVHGGYKKSKALLLNFLVALTVIIGGIIGYFFSSMTQMSISSLLPIAAGGFIYIGASDLIPEMRKELNIKTSTFHLITFIIGVIIMYLLKFLVAI
jgi:zinc and cadmium transporter